jgi:hypothetical protein
MRASKYSNFRIALLIFLLAFVVRLGIMLASRPYKQLFRTEIHHIAISITNGTGYGNPYLTPTGPTAHYSPGCPLIVAAVYRIFGTGEAAEVASYTLNIAGVSSVYAFLPLVCVCLGLPRGAGILAAIVGAIVPVYPLNEFRSISAVSGAFCLELLTLMTAYAWSSGRTLTGGLGALFGSAWGIALLISPNLLLVGLSWLAVAACRYRLAMARFAIVFVTVIGAVMLPWAIRNALVLGSPIFLRSNLGLELQIANNDLATPALKDNAESFASYHPFVNRSESESVHRLGELVYMRQKMDQATGWIDHHPLPFVALTGARIFLFWLPRTYKLGQSIVVWTLTLVGFAGLVFAWKRQRAAFWILGSIWFAYPFMYYLVQLNNPYRYPMHWSVLLLAAYGCISSAEVLGWSSQHDVSRLSGRHSPPAGV